MIQTTFPILVTQELLHDWTDLAKVKETVGAALVDLGQDDEKWMHFIVAYVSWRGRFANGVSALASFIGEQKNLFKDATVPTIVADRSNYIASFIFDAARNQYAEQIQEQQNTYRCLGQATIMGASDFFGIDLNLFSEPQWLHRFGNSVLEGYTGASAFQVESIQTNPLPGELLHSIFQGIGYHLGSELLADQEFSIIDNLLRDKKPELVDHLLRYSTTFSGGQHCGYAWIGIHSGSSRDDRFRHALKGVNEALRLLSAHLTDECMLALRHGFLRFFHDHTHFYQRAGRVTE